MMTESSHANHPASSEALARSNPSALRSLCIASLNLDCVTLKSPRLKKVYVGSETNLNEMGGCGITLDQFEEVTKI